MSDAALIALDWGTTSARAYRLDAAGRVLDARSGPLGILQVPERDFRRALDTLLGDWATLRVPRLASGMIGSRQGWIEAPYVATPASADALAAGIVRVPDADVSIVPGVRTRGSDGMPDVIRGEETQVLGAIDAGAPLAFAVLPGTHSKWARVEHGRLAAFTTFMTGEVYAALLGHTIIGRLASPQDDASFDAESFRRGVARGLAGGALLHDVFGARALALLGELAPTAVADWLSGLLIGSEIHGARRWAPELSEVQIVSGEALARRYADACALAGLTARMAAPDAAARGLWRLALHAHLVDPTTSRVPR